MIYLQQLNHLSLILYFIIISYFILYFRLYHFSFYHIGGISFSGTAFDCWTQTENALEKTKKLSALMGCPTTTSRDMIRCLRYRPARAIVQATSEFMVSFVS